MILKNTQSLPESMANLYNHCDHMKKALKEEKDNLKAEYEAKLESEKKAMGAESESIKNEMKKELKEEKNNLKAEYEAKFQSEKKTMGAEIESMKKEMKKARLQSERKKYWW